MEKIQYNKDRPRQAYQLALLGHTNKEMAEVMGVNEQTIDYWKRTKTRFAVMLARGKDQADAKVAEALYKRAIGYSHPDTDIKVLKNEIIVTPFTKHYPPDTQACKIWLALRQRVRWSETQKFEVTNTNINITKIDLTGFSTEELLVVKKLGLKQLTENAGEN